MKPRTVYLLTLAAFAALLGFAWAGYHHLGSSYAPEPEEVVLTSETLDYASDFTVIDSEGNPVRLSDYIGTPVLINFWASWCGPCKSELPYFDAAYEAYGDQTTFLMVDLADGVQETEAKAKTFLAEQGYSFPAYFDTTGEAANAYRIYSIPLTVAVNREGKIVFSQPGALTEERLDSILQEFLG